MKIQLIVRCRDSLGPNLMPGEAEENIQAVRKVVFMRLSFLYEKSEKEREREKRQKRYKV